MILFRASSNKTYNLNPRGSPIGIHCPTTTFFAIDRIRYLSLMRLYPDQLYGRHHRTMNDSAICSAKNVSAVDTNYEKDRPTSLSTICIKRFFLYRRQSHNDNSLVCIKEKTTAETDATRQRCLSSGAGLEGPSKRRAKKAASPSMPITNIKNIRAKRDRGRRKPSSEEER
jgi:hypothetical protein